MKLPILLLTLGGAAAYVLSHGTPRRQQVCMRAEQQQRLSRQDALSGLGLMAVGTASSFLLATQEAKAEYTLANRKVAYRRYVPRILEGKEFFQVEFKKMVESKRWNDIVATFQKEDQAAPDSESRQRFNAQRVINVWEKNLFSPMKVYSQSFSEKGTSPRLAELLKAEGDLETAIRRLELVATGNLKPPQPESNLPFGLGTPEAAPDKYAGKSQADMANALYADAKQAFNEWIEIVNRSIGLQLNPIDPIA